MALTDYVIMPGTDYQAICDAIRAKTGKTDVIKSGDAATEIEAIEVSVSTNICYIGSNTPDSSIGNDGDIYIVKE